MLSISPDMDWTAIIIAAIGALGGGGLVAFFTARSTAAQQVSEAAGTLVESFTTQLANLEQDVAALRARVDQLEKVNRRLRVLVHSLLDGIKQLMVQIKGAGLMPTWCPPTDEQIEAILNGHDT